MVDDPVLPQNLYKRIRIDKNKNRIWLQKNFGASERLAVRR